MQISIIVAKAKNNAIGKDGNLLWHLPKDMKLFKETTLNHCILTGRKNFYSIPEKFRPLTNRTNIIISRNITLNEPGAIVQNSIQKGIEYAQSLGEKELFIIGGGEIYKQTILIADKLYVTEVDAIFEDADTFFPLIDYNIWKEVQRVTFEKDDKNCYKFDFVIYSKR